jgi:hypothetical protein
MLMIRNRLDLQVEAGDPSGPEGDPSPVRACTVVDGMSPHDDTDGTFHPSVIT